jgi:hypothetical protein
MEFSGKFAVEEIWTSRKAEYAMNEYGYQFYV